MLKNFHEFSSKFHEFSKIIFRKIPDGTLIEFVRTWNYLNYVSERVFINHFILTIGPSEPMITNFGLRL